MKKKHLFGIIVIAIAIGIIVKISIIFGRLKIHSVIAAIKTTVSKTTAIIRCLGKPSTLVRIATWVIVITAIKAAVTKAPTISKPCAICAIA